MDRQRAVRSHRYKYIKSWYPEVPGGHALAYRDNLDMVRAWRQAWSKEQLSPNRARWFEPAGAEQLYDLQTDPFELNNLAHDPRHSAQLNTLREALDMFLKRVGDTSEVDEQQLRKRFLQDNQVPITPPPEVAINDGQVTLTSAIGASVGYQLAGEKRWRLYTQPIPARTMQVKAVRYGWRESDVVNLP